MGRLRIRPEARVSNAACDSERPGWPFSPRGWSSKPPPSQGVIAARTRLDAPHQASLCHAAPTPTPGRHGTSPGVTAAVRTRQCGDDSAGPPGSAPEPDSRPVVRACPPSHQRARGTSDM